MPHFLLSLFIPELETNQSIESDEEEENDKFVRKAD
jgi:hypothetical protein